MGAGRGPSLAGDLGQPSVDSWNRMIAPAAHPAAAIAAQPPTRPISSSRPPPTPFGPARQVGPEAVGGQCGEDDRQDDRTGGQQGIWVASRTVSEVGRERERPDDGEREEDRSGRDASTAPGRVIAVLEADVVGDIAIPRSRGGVRRRAGSVMRTPLRRCDGRPRRCTTAAAGSSDRRPRAPARRTQPRGTVRASSSDANVHQQCTTRILKPDAKERAVAAAPRPVLATRPAQLGDVVAAVVVDDQQPAAGSKEPRQPAAMSSRACATERRPQPDDDVGGRLGRGERRRSARIRRA